MNLDELCVEHTTLMKWNTLTVHCITASKLAITMYSAKNAMVYLQTQRRTQKRKPEVIINSRQER